MATTHGQSKTRLYSCWRQMKSRCHNPKANGYLDYGGRGITVCDDWLDFVLFSEWALSNGYADNLSIERKNINGIYEPSNCIWADQSRQNSNRRPRKKQKQKYIGIYQILKNGKWAAAIAWKGKRKHLGCFSSEEEALSFRNQYIKDNNLPHLIQK